MFSYTDAQDLNPPEACFMTKHVIQSNLVYKPENQFKKPQLYPYHITYPLPLQHSTSHFHSETSDFFNFSISNFKYQLQIYK
jgi:hypothetical protein